MGLGSFQSWGQASQTQHCRVQHSLGEVVVDVTLSGGGSCPRPSVSQSFIRGLASCCSLAGGGQLLLHSIAIAGGV